GVDTTADCTRPSPRAACAAEKCSTVRRMNSLNSRSHLALPRPLGTLGFVAAWLTPWRPAFRTTAAHSKRKFFAAHRDAIRPHHAKYGTDEPLVTRWMGDFLDAAPRGIAIDIGANLGWHAARGAASQCRDTGGVRARSVQRLAAGAQPVGKRHR